MNSSNRNNTIRTSASRANSSIEENTSSHLKTIENPRTTTPIRAATPTATTVTTTIYVGNIDKRINENHLQKLFNRFGTILRICKPNNNMSNSNYCYAFVEYETSTSSKAAISNINGKLLLGKHLVVKFATTKNNWKHPRGRSSVSTSRDAIIASGDKKSIEKEKKELDKKITSVKKAIEVSQGDE